MSFFLYSISICHLSVFTIPTSFAVSLLSLYSLYLHHLLLSLYSLPLHHLSFIFAQSLLSLSSLYSHHLSKYFIAFHYLYTNCCLFSCTRISICHLSVFTIPTSSAVSLLSLYSLYLHHLLLSISSLSLAPSVFSHTVCYLFLLYTRTICLSILSSFSLHNPHIFRYLLLLFSYTICCCLSSHHLSFSLSLYPVFMYPRPLSICPNFRIFLYNPSLSRPHSLFCAVWKIALFLEETVPPLRGSPGWFHSYSRNECTVCKSSKARPPQQHRKKKNIIQS